jgi:O-antigen/teichoic acid export membrane protein
MAKHKAFAYFALAEGVANVVLSTILVQKMGLIGVAWGTVIPSLICSTVVVPLYTLRVLKMDPVSYFFAAYLRPILCAVPIAALGYVFLQTRVATPLVFVGEVASILGLFTIASYFVVLTPSQRTLMSTRISAMFQRQAVIHET